MTATEIIEKLKEFSGRDFAYEFDNREGFGKAEIVHEEGDTEGGGDYSCVVRYFEEHDVYIQVTGFYSSYEGTDWDNDFQEVKPKEKTITVFE